MTDPISVLQSKLRTDQDRQARLQIEARDLAVRLTAAREGLQELGDEIAQTRGLLALADRYVTQQNAAKPDPTPAKKTTSKKAATS